MSNTDANANTQKKYYTINSFMRFILEKEDDSQVEFIDLYFIPAQSFRNQFNNTCIKPVALLIKPKGSKAKSFKYTDMMEYLDHIPIVSFKPNMERRVYKKQELQKLVIRSDLKEYEGRQYYDSKIITVNDKTVIDKIKADIPKQSSKMIDVEDIEVELFE